VAATISRCTSLTPPPNVLICADRPARSSRPLSTAPGDPGATYPTGPTMSRSRRYTWTWVSVPNTFADERTAGESFREWIDRVGGAKAIAAELKELDQFPAPEDGPEFYVDYDETGPYEAEVGAGECAGV